MGGCVVAVGDRPREAANRLRVVGVVLNDIRATGAYKYYSYLDGYAASDESAPALAGGGTNEGWK